jgi:cytochrome c oxidase subunit I+III
VFIVDLARRFRMASEGNAGNVWNAGTLEWLPNGNYSNRSIPIVDSREPLWQDPQLPSDVEQGRYYLPNAPTGGRETLVTSPITAEPQWLLRMPMPGWAPLVAAWFTAAFFLLLTFKLVVLAFACGVVAIGAMLHWAWGLDPKPPAQRVDIGGGIQLPAYVSGALSQAWWAMGVLMLVAASIYGCALFSYLYLWTVAPQHWPGAHALPPAGYAWASGALLLAASAGCGLANRQLARGGTVHIGLLAAVACLVAAFAIDLTAHRSLSPSASGYAAVVYLLLSLEGFYIVTVVVMAWFAQARQVAGRLDRERRVTFDNTRLFLHYTVAQSLLGVVVLHGFPRLVGG